MICIRDFCILFYLLLPNISIKTSKHPGSWKHPADQFKCFQFGMIISFAWSFSARNRALCNGTNESLSPCMIAKLCADCLIRSKSKSFSKKLSNLLLLFLSEGDETSIIQETWTPCICSRHLRIAGPPREWPIRYISSCWFWTICLFISPTHSEHKGFSGAGIGRAHAYMSLFSNSLISHGRHPPFGLPSKPWIIKTFFIYYLMAAPFVAFYSSFAKASEDILLENINFCSSKAKNGAQGGTRTLTPCGTGFWNLRVYHFTTWAGSLYKWCPRMGSNHRPLA